MAQLLKVLAALAENPGLVSSTHMTTPNYTTPGPGTRSSFSLVLWALHAPGALLCWQTC